MATYREVLRQAQKQLRDKDMNEQEAQLYMVELCALKVHDLYMEIEQEMDAEAKHITQVNPDFLIVGMGALMQERFLLKVRNAGFQGIGFTCGGFIHQTANNEIEYYPLWIDRMNLRFVYRMYKEKHTRKRYVQAALLFPARFLWEKLIFSWYKDSKPL